MNKYLVFAFLFSLSTLNAQEIVRPLMIDVQKAEQFRKEARLPERAPAASRVNGLDLPFIDDFSRYSLPTNDPDVPLEWQMWTDATVRINNSLPVNPMTVGVATLDGLDEGGFPYDFDNQFSYGSADTLTSCPINLNGFNSEDNVKLVFHYQTGGQGNPPDFEDELIVEFLVPNSNPPLWQEVWSVQGSGINTSDFQRVFIHVNDALWLTSGFQFRFRNYGTLSGNVDHWHLDYVWLDEDIVDDEFEITDVSATGNPTTLINSYHSIPWEHFQSIGGQPSIATQNVQFRNLDEDRNINFGSSFFFEDTELANFDQGVNTALNGFSTFTQQFSINDGSPNNFSYPTDVADTCATFTVKYYCNTSPDINADNDTLSFEQHFGNYYAYDDGSAEGAYALNEQGSATAMRFQNLKGDSLLGLLIHFTPFTLNNSDETFILRAWQDGVNNQPGEEYQENFILHSPGYYSEGYDVFEYYEYDSPIYIDTMEFFHVGFVQTTNAELNVGYDKSNNANSGNLNFKLDPFGIWTSSGVSGALMIRPVFQTDKELMWDFVNVEEEEWNEPLLMYPNPAGEVLNSFDFKRCNGISILNSTGAIIKEEELSGESIYVGDLSTGFYYVQLFKDGHLVQSGKFMKQ